MSALGRVRFHRFHWSEDVGFVEMTKLTKVMADRASGH